MKQIISACPTYNSRGIESCHVVAQNMLLKRKWMFLLLEKNIVLKSWHLNEMFQSCWNVTLWPKINRDVERVLLVLWFWYNITILFSPIWVWWQNQAKKKKIIFKQSIRIPARFCQESNLEENCLIRYNADHHCCSGLGCTEMGSGSRGMSMSGASPSEKNLWPSNTIHPSWGSAILHWWAKTVPRRGLDPRAGAVNYNRPSPHLELDLQNKHWAWLKWNETAKSILQRLFRDFQPI